MDKTNPLQKTAAAYNTQRPRDLFQVMREQMRLAHMSIFTEKSYIQWIKRFIGFHRGRHPRGMGPRRGVVHEFLDRL